MVALARRKNPCADHSCRDEGFRRSVNSSIAFPTVHKIGMNLLIVHNTYQQTGGEDIVVEQERRLLERYGHKVTVYQRSNHELDSLSFAQRLGLISRIVSASDSESSSWLLR